MSGAHTFGAKKKKWKECAVRIGSNLEIEDRVFRSAFNLCYSPGQRAHVQFHASLFARKKADRAMAVSGQRSKVRLANIGDVTLLEEHRLAAGQPHAQRREEARLA
jgi:hypothetical protein